VRSLTASVKGLEKAKLVLRSKCTPIDSFNTIYSRQVVRRFFRRVPIKAEFFQGICAELGLTWEEVADLDANTPQPVQDVDLDALAQEVCDSTSHIILPELKVKEEAISVFLSYSRQDKNLLDKLITHLAGLRRTGKITTWHDRDIEAGSEWEPELQRQLDTADIILLLISADFMASDYCYGKELQRAIERHYRNEARVIPVILRPCDWKIPEIPFSKLNALPSDAEPIVSSKWQYLDEAFEIVAKGIREVSDQLKYAQSSNKIQINIASSENTMKELVIPKQQESQSTIDNSIDNVILASEQGVDYHSLRDFLKAGEWKKADQETLKTILKAANRESQGWLDADSLKEFPCQDLKTIDLLWVIASNGHFGISVQTKIWGECGSPMAYSDTWKLFCDRVGWYKKGNPLKFSDLKFSLGYSQKGELPSWVWSEENAGDLIRGEVFFARAKACEL
jgi:GUN4-like/TIR domain